MKEYSENVYSPPVKKEKIEMITVDQPMLTEQQKSHTGNLKNSIDFIVPEGTEIFAALDGEITSIRDDDKTGGPDKKFLMGGNFIVIKHSNQEFTHYLHLKYKGVLVKVGEKVKAGQLIGYSGNTGYSFKPHLHFEVFIWPSPKAKPEERVTIKARFKDMENIYENNQKGSRSNSLS